MFKDSICSNQVRVSLYASNQIKSNQIKSNRAAESAPNELRSKSKEKCVYGQCQGRGLETYQTCETRAMYMSLMSRRKTCAHNIGSFEKLFFDDIELISPSAKATRKTQQGSSQKATQSNNAHVKQSSSQPKIINDQSQILLFLALSPQTIHDEARIAIAIRRIWPLQC